MEAVRAWDVRNKSVQLVLSIKSVQLPLLKMLYCMLSMKLQGLLCRDLLHIDPVRTLKKTAHPNVSCIRMFMLLIYYDDHFTLYHWFVN